MEVLDECDEMIALPYGWMLELFLFHLDFCYLSNPAAVLDVVRLFVCRGLNARLGTAVVATVAVAGVGSLSRRSRRWGDRRWASDGFPVPFGW